MSGYLQDVAEQPGLLRRPLPDLTPERLLLQDCEVVRLVGIGSSRHVAAYGAACVELLTGRPASLLAAPGAGVPQPRFSADEALVVVSQSGATPALLELARTAREAGAAVIALTNAPASPLARLATLSLACGAGAERVVPATKSVLTSMLLLRALAAPVDPEALTRCADSVASLVRASVAATGPVPGYVVCGGVAAQAVADEVALKLAEVAGLPVVAESVVDYLHGPAAVQAPLVALLEADDPNRPALLGRPDVQVLDVDPCGDGTLDQLTRLVAGQLLAAAWADRLGIDQDDPKGLAKVTRTA